MLDTLIKAIQNNQTETFLIAGVVAIIIWLYKEIRNTYIETEKINIERINKALEVYAELQIELCKYVDNVGSDIALESKLVKAYPYFPKSLLDRFVDWKIWQSEQDTKKLLEELGKEILRIKFIQKDVVSYKPTDSIDSIGYFLHSIKASSYIQPFKFLTGALVAIYFILVAISYFEKADVLGGICIILTFINSFFYFIFFMIFIDTLSQKRFINSLKNWLFLVLFIVFPAITMVFYQWYFTCISFVLFWIYIKFILPKSMQNTSE